MAKFIRKDKTGGPVLTGKRLERTLAQCDPRHLIVQPRYRKVIDAQR